MNSVHLFDLAHRQANWLSARQVTIAGNIANANTPNFQARDVQPFADVLGNPSLSMAATNKAHLETDLATVAPVRLSDQNGTEKTHSGNSVDLEKEMIDAGQVAREYSLNTSIVKAFHRMMLTVVKG